MSALFAAIDFVLATGGRTVTDATVDFRGSMSPYTTYPIGDWQGNGTLFVSDRTATAKRLAMGYDAANSLAVIQSMNAGVTVTSLLLNPSGGALGLGLMTWQSPLRDAAGTRWLWTDTSGQLCIRSGAAPTSDTNGTVVGTQT